MKMWMRAAAMGLVLGAAAAPMALAQTAPAAGDAVFRATTVNVSAYGETKIAPDQATINLGVMTEAASAKEAMAQNGVRMNQVMAALNKGGIAAKDIQTSQLSLEPQYVYEQNQPPRLTGYRATNQVTVTVHDLTRLGAAVDAVVSAGANQIGNINFSLADPTAAENAAREKAVKALADKADLYARASGHRVLRLVTLSEGGSFSPPPPVPMVAMAARYKEADTAVAPGEVKVRVDVSGIYELTR